MTTGDMLKSFGLENPPPESCYKCIYSRRRHTSLGDIIRCTVMRSDVGAAFYDPYDILNQRHPNCIFNKEQNERRNDHEF